MNKKSSKGAPGASPEKTRAPVLEKRVRELEATRKAILNILEDVSEAKDALEKSGARYQDLYDHAPVMYHTISLDGEILECNEEVLRKLGYDRDEYVGHNLKEFLAPQYSEILPDVIREIIKKKGIEGFYREYVRKDGSLLPVELSVSVMKGDLGRPVALRAALVDISDRIEKEKAERRLLIESQLRSETFKITSLSGYDVVRMKEQLPELAGAMRVILSAVCVAIFHHDEMKQTYINCAISADEKILQKMKQLIPEFEGEMTFPIGKNEEMMKIMRGDVPTVSGSFDRLFGHTKNIAAHDTLFEGKRVLLIPVKPFGKPWGLVGLVVEPGNLALEMHTPIRAAVETSVVRIGEFNARIREQKAREESEKRYKSVVENATDIIFKTDLDGNINFVNPAGAKITEYPQDELIGMNYENLVHPEDRDQVRRLYEQQFKSREEESKFQCRIVTKSGQKVWLGIYSTLVLEDDWVTGWQSIARNITDRKMAEEKAAIRHKRIMALNEATGSLTSTLDSQEVANRCCFIARELIEADGASIFLLNPEGTSLEPVVAVGPFAEEVMSMTLKTGEGITGGVAVSGKSEIANRADLSGRGSQIPGTPVVPESLLCAPLKTMDRTIGVISLRHAGTREFSEEDLVFLENLANVSAIAIENARLYQSLERSERDYRSMVETTVDPVIVIDESSRVILWNPAARKTFGFSEKEMLGKSVEKLYPTPEGFQRYEKELQNFFKTGDSPIFGEPIEVQVSHKKGRLIDIILSVSPYRTDKGWTFTAFMKDITEQRKARREIERLANFPNENPLPVVEVDLNGKMTYINPAGEKLLKQMNLKKKDLPKILPPRYKELVKQGLERADDIRSQEVRLGDSVLLWTAHPLKPLRLVHFYAADITQLKNAEEELRVSRDQLRRLSSHLEWVREQERKNIARDIHDELGQTLTALKMDLSWLSKRLPEDEDSLVEKAKIMSGIIDKLVKSVKRISTELRPGLLDDLGLTAAVEWQVEEFENRTGIQCELILNPREMVLEGNLSTAIFRVFQETLTNVARHSGATRVRVSLKRANNYLRLKVIDNGRGITQEEAASPKSFGLLGMRERVFPWGGNVKISGIKDKGTTVTVAVSLEKKEGMEPDQAG